MDIMEFLTEFYKYAERQGPGSCETTLQALHTIPNYQSFERVLDIGCGTGAGTLVLARNLPNAEVTALDLLQEFLDELNIRAESEGLKPRIETVEGSMDSMPFLDNAFDLVWAEGCIYHIGFERGLREWKRLIKLDGYIVVSELCWITDDRPKELAEYWSNLYPGIGTVVEKIDILKDCGYKLIHHFAQNEECWVNNYYNPSRERSKKFAQKHGNAPEVMAFIDEEIREADFYDRYKKYYSYVFFVMSR